MTKQYNVIQTPASFTCEVTIKKKPRREKDSNIGYKMKLCERALFALIAGEFSKDSMASIELVCRNCGRYRREDTNVFRLKTGKSNITQWEKSHEQEN